MCGFANNILKDVYIYINKYVHKCHVGIVKHAHGLHKVKACSITFVSRIF